MAQLRDSTIDGNLEITGDVIFKVGDNGVRGIHPETGETVRMIHTSVHGNTVVGYDNYVNKNGNTHIYGNDVAHYIASADANFRPYYRAGDTISFTGNSSVRTAGYVTNAGKNVVFTIPVPKPIIGSPSVSITGGQGLVLRQSGNYTHGSGASAFVKPTSYSVILNNSGFVVTAVFDDTTNVVNNDATGVYWDGIITLS